MKNIVVSAFILLFVSIITFNYVIKQDEEKQVDPSTQKALWNMCQACSGYCEGVYSSLVHACSIDECTCVFWEGELFTRRWDVVNLEEEDVYNFDHHGTTHSQLEKYKRDYYEEYVTRLHEQRELDAMTPEDQCSIILDPDYDTENFDLCVKETKESEYKNCELCINMYVPSECYTECAGVEMHGYMGMKDIPRSYLWREVE